MFRFNVSNVMTDLQQLKSNFGYKTIRGTVGAQKAIKVMPGVKQKNNPEMKLLQNDFGVRNGKDIFKVERVNGHDRVNEVKCNFGIKTIENKCGGKRVIRP